MSSSRYHLGTSSVPGSLSDKYRGVDLNVEDTESIKAEDVNKTKKVGKQQQKRKSTPLPIHDDGVITTISHQEENTQHDDRCSSVISLSDKYRTQEEIEIFQVLLGEVCLFGIKMESPCCLFCTYI